MSGSTGKWHSWQLILWGSSIDPSKAKPHPLPGSEEDPTVTTPIPLPHPTVNPPHETGPAVSPTPPDTPSETTAPEAPESGFWPWSPERKWVWIYSSIAGIALFVSIIGVWYGLQRRKVRILQTRGAGREDYEFEMLPDDGDVGIQQRRAGELYDAFAGAEEFIHQETGVREGGERGDEIGDREMDGFLGESEDEDD
jgi:kexin